MRRSLFNLALTILAIGLVSWFVMVPPRDRVVAEEPPAATQSKVPRDNFVVPEARQASALVDYVEALKSVRPEPGAAAAEYEAKAPLAIRKACERILELDKDPKSAANRFACRELLTFRMSDLAESDRADTEERQQLARDILQILKDSDQPAVDVELATTLATTFEDFAPVEEATAMYKSLGALFTQVDSPDVARRGEYLLGASRRLGIIGQPLQLHGQTVDGQDFDIASLKGKVVLVDFWATWCTHCLEELPELKEAYKSYHEQGFEIVGISVDDDRDDLERFLKKQRLPWATLHDAEAGSEHPAAIHYGITAYPTSFLVDRDGRVVAVDLQGRKLIRKLDRLCGVAEGKPSYPVFNVGDVINKLTSAGAKLHKTGKTAGDRELRKQLSRRSVELDLPEPYDDIISDRDLYRRACESVFIVCSLYKEEGDEWQTSLATAFAVTADGVLTTSCHVFDNKDEADAIVVMDMHRKVYPVKELLAANSKADTCLFRIEASNLKPLPLADNVPPGTPVRVLGHPGDSFYFLSSGLVANYEKDHDGLTWLNVTADFGQGASGGPVLDEYGNVVAQVSRTYTLYAGGPETRRRPRRVAAETPKEKREREPDPKNDPDPDVADPQMVFKSCVPVKTLRSLVQQKQASPEAAAAR